MLSYQGFSRDGLPVIDTHALLDAALRASWQRDHRVGSRRLAVRWLVWGIGKYFFHILAIAALVFAAVFLLNREGYFATPTPAPVKTNTAPSVQLHDPAELQLQSAFQLAEHRNPSTPSSTATEGTTTVDAALLHPLRLETQIKIRETAP